MNPIWLLRMKRWIQHPPSRNRVVLVAGVVAASLVVAAIESLWGWPAWLTVTSVRP
jgi:hypothetical protein